VESGKTDHEGFLDAFFSPSRTVGFGSVMVVTREDHAMGLISGIILYASLVERKGS